MHLRATAVLAGLILLAVPASAPAVISDIHPIDGPGADVLAVGGAARAMASDGWVAVASPTLKSTGTGR